MKQIITINTKGEIATLEFKKGVNVKSLGKAKVRRVTDIVWSEDDECWEIQSLQGKLAGCCVTKAVLQDCGLLSNQELAESLRRLASTNNDCLFDNYEAAVQFEILMIQTARKLELAHLFVDHDLI